MLRVSFDKAPGLQRAGSLPVRGHPGSGGLGVPGAGGTGAALRWSDPDWISLGRRAAAPSGVSESLLPAGLLRAPVLRGSKLGLAGASVFMNPEDVREALQGS